MGGGRGITLPVVRSFQGTLSLLRYLFIYCLNIAYLFYDKGYAIKKIIKVRVLLRNINLFAYWNGANIFVDSNNKNIFKENKIDSVYVMCNLWPLNIQMKREGRVMGVWVKLKVLSTHFISINTC